MIDPGANGVVHYPSPTYLSIGPRRFDVTSRALVMGIVNRTPDSFFDQGATFPLELALKRAEQLVDEGADIIDVGGVKAGSGPDVPADEEIERVLPVVESLVERFDVPVSVDSWSATVADACFSAGASLGNDISGFQDPGYLPVASRHGASVVATHIRLAPRVDDPDPRYPNDDVVSAVTTFLKDRLEMAVLSGIPREKVLFDVGLDLGKTTPQSLELLRATDRFAALGQPMLLSASNKGFLGDLFGLPIERRGDASLLATALGVVKGCRVVRVHDVKRSRRVVETIAAVLSQ
ncbi:MAG: dihydropteroate synthase [Acidimicrobiales bacterium]